MPTSNIETCKDADSQGWNSLLEGLSLLVWWCHIELLRKQSCLMWSFLIRNNLIKPRLTFVSQLNVKNEMKIYKYHVSPLKIS